MDRNTARIEIEKLLPLQQKGEKFPCPRCGHDRMHSDSVVLNALSRYATVYICEECGMDEAMRDMFGDPLPLEEWAMVATDTFEIRYEVECFGRILVITFDKAYKDLESEILEMLDDFYGEWHNSDDPIVECMCCEEYMMDRLSETYSIWDDWTVEEE